MAEEPKPLEFNEELQPLPVDEEPLTIEEGSNEAGPSKIQSFGKKLTDAGAHKELTRPINLTGTGATRCRLFHSKVTVAAMEYMVAQINEWLDRDKVEIKYSTQVVGVLEGKNPEPNVITTVWF